MTAKRFKRYLFDGGFSFGEEYVPPKWSISDENTNGSPFGFLEFDDEHKDLCDEIVDSLNEFVDEYNHLKEENERLNQQLRIFSDGLKAEIRETKEVFEDYLECVDEKKQLKEKNEQLKSKLESAEEVLQNMGYDLVYSEIYGRWVVE